MKKLSVSEILYDFVALFYPKCCEACEGPLVKGEEILCTRCLLELPRTHYHQDPKNYLYQKFEGRLPLVFASAFLKFYKKGKVKHLLHALKYKHKPEIGVMLGRLYGADLLTADWQKDIDVIVPVPLHHSRQRQRGYNQSEQFAMGLGATLNKKMNSMALVRLVRTATQTRRTKLNRWENVSEVFSVKRPEDLAGKHVMLVDDVVTTGATLEACASVIIAAGCKALSIVCIAVVVR